MSTSRSCLPARAGGVPQPDADRGRANNAGHPPFHATFETAAALLALAGVGIACYEHLVAHLPEPLGYISEW